MSKTTNLREEFDKLVVAISKKAAQSSTSLQESTEALEAVTKYYAVILKHEGEGKGDDAGDSTTFGAFSSQINGPPENLNGRAEVPNRRGRDS